MSGPPAVDLEGALAAPVDRLLERLPSAPAADRRRGGDRWLVFELEGLSLRVRCEGASGTAGVSSWTARFENPPASLRAAAERVGLWPELEPDASAPEVGGMIRRPLPGADEGTVHSLTAAVRDGAVVQMTAFDEPPDWTGE